MRTSNHQREAHALRIQRQFHMQEISKLVVQRNHLLAALTKASYFPNILDAETRALVEATIALVKDSITCPVCDMPVDEVTVCTSPDCGREEAR
jgi:hypothetical protein